MHVRSTFAVKKSLCYCLKYTVLCVTDSTGYAQIYFPVEVNEALERNSRRNFPVADDVIISMSSKMDIPTPQNSWEALTAEWHATDHSQRNL